MQIPEEILAVARDSAFRFGSVDPMFFVHGTKGKVYMPLPFGKTFSDRVNIMMQAGVALAKRNDIGDVERVIFVSEPWISPARQPYMAPSQDPDRQEVLLFNLLDATTNREELEIYACVRNGRKDIVELTRIPQPEEGTVEGRLLPLFMAGFKLFKR